MKFHIARVVIVVLCISAFAIGQEASTSIPSVPRVVTTPGGTTNYIPLWTGTTTIANSVVFQSGSKVGIGTTAPAATLDVNGAINTASTYNLGGVLFAFGSSGSANAFLGFAGNSTTTGSLNTASGAYALSSNTTGTGSTAVGFRALHSNTTGGLNTACGNQALNSNTTGFQNTASGNWALFSNTTGALNTASGAGALYSNSTGNYNDAFGSQVLYSNTTGYENTAIGGDGALYSNTTGYYNSAVGSGALFSNTTGYYNSGIGVAALFSNTTGNSLTCIGDFCGVSADGLSNATAIGAQAVVGQSNSLVLGSINGVNNAVSNTNVGIGTTAPIRIFTIGQGFGHAIADGWDTYSSRRWKTNIHLLHGALSKVEQLRGVSYNLKDSGRHEIGVIAEEVGAVVPEVVSWDKNGRDAQGVDYGRLTALLIEATKEQQVLIHQQREEILVQQKQITTLSQQVSAIRAALDAGERTDSRVHVVEGNTTVTRH